MRLLTCEGFHHILIMPLTCIQSSYNDLKCLEYLGSRPISLSTQAASGPGGTVGGPYGSRSAKFRSVDGLKGMPISDRDSHGYIATSQILGVSKTYRNNLLLLNV